MDSQNLKRINELAKLAKQRPLTEEEQRERHERREKYLKAFRQSFTNELNNTVIQYPDGTKEPLRKK